MYYSLSLADRISWTAFVVAFVFIGLLLLTRSTPVKATDLYVPSLPPAREVTRPADGVNTSRSTDLLIVYTPASNRPTTGTNQWGTEAVVQDGRVILVGGNNQTIPPNGFVVSAHGAAIPWLQENLRYGAKVEFNGRELHVVIDDDTHLLAAQRALDHVHQSLGNARGALSGEALERTAALIDQAEAALDAGRYSQAIQLAAQARFTATPSFPVEVRGVWHRPEELTPRQIELTLDRLQAAGFNALFLESFYTGYTIYPSKIAPQRAQFVGWDPLEVWATEAAKRGIELHLWVHLFHLGKVTIDTHPEWTNLQRDGSLGSTLEPGLYYGDPGHPEVRQYILEVLKEMVERYPVAGLHLDYVRYPYTDNLSNTSGYSPTARQLFQEAYGHDPLEITPTSHPHVWAQWLKWQEDNVTQFVESVNTWVRDEWPDLAISGAVVPDIYEAIRSKRQNWLAWTEAGWIDFLTPMIYSLDNGHVERQIKDLIGNTGSAWLVPGIAPFMGMTPHQVIDQVTASRLSGQPGAVLFALHSVRAEHRAAFSAGLFSTPAATPWQRRDAIDAFGTWVIDGMGRWVAEDVLPPDTAVSLDALAHEMVAWHESETPELTQAARWAEILLAAKAELENPFYGNQSLWLQKQLQLMSEVLTHGQ